MSAFVECIALALNAAQRHSISLDKSCSSRDLLQPRSKFPNYVGLRATRSFRAAREFEHTYSKPLLIVASADLKSSASLAVPESEEKSVLTAVEKLYDKFPFPPDPLSDGPPPGYNFRWHYQTAHQFSLGYAPSAKKEGAFRILDAGCGTGNCADFLAHLNPDAKVTAFDLSSGALALAKERAQRSGVADRVTFHHMSIYDAKQLLEQEGHDGYDYINCVGVLHHLPDPARGLQALKDVLKPGGVMHVFVYGELGRWEIMLMQRAINILQGDQSGDYALGVDIGRRLFKSLPKDNRLRLREEIRWADENRKDETFADMYVHPREVDFNIDSLFNWINGSGLTFLNFSNPNYWSPHRLLASDPELLARFNALPTDAEGMQKRYRLVELLDPEGATHYEFFLGKPPLSPPVDWSDDAQLSSAVPRLSPCLHGWPSPSLLDYEFELLTISPAQEKFLKACSDQSDQSCFGLMGPSGATGNKIQRVRQDESLTVGDIVSQIEGCTLDDVRSLIPRLVLLLERS